MSSTMSHPRSSLKRTSVSSTSSSESNYSETYYPNPRNSVEYSQEFVRAPPRGSMHTTDPQAFYGRPYGRTMHNTFTTAGRMSTATTDVLPPRRRNRVSFSEEEELRFYSPSHPPNKFLKPKHCVSRMFQSFVDVIRVDESRLYQPPPPKRMTADMAEARTREYRRATGGW